VVAHQNIAMAIAKIADHIVHILCHDSFDTNRSVASAVWEKTSYQIIVLVVIAPEEASVL